MPPFKQPKKLSDLSNHSFSLWACLSMKKLRTEQDAAAFRDVLNTTIPFGVWEEVSRWILKCGYEVMEDYIRTPRDRMLGDVDIVYDCVRYLNMVLKCILVPGKVRHFEPEFIINLEELGKIAQVHMPSMFKRRRTIDVDDMIFDIPDVEQINITCTNFIESLSREQQEAIVSFNPKLMVAGRHSIWAILNHQMKRPCVSLTWLERENFAFLTQHCTHLVVLNLEQVDELEDGHLAFIAGKIKGPPLVHLRELTLAKTNRSTGTGMKLLLLNCPELTAVYNSGHLGQSIDLLEIQPPSQGNQQFKLIELNQLSLIQEVDSRGNVHNQYTWNPSENSVSRIGLLCPDLKVLRLTVKEKKMELFTDLKRSNIDIEELEAHFLGPIGNGLDLFATGFSHSLTKIYLEYLYPVRWNSIEVIGKLCHNVRVFHLECWGRVDRERFTRNRRGEPYFVGLKELQVSVISHPSFMFPKFVFDYFMGCHSQLTKIEYAANLSWITHETVEELCNNHTLDNIETLILDNNDESKGRLELPLATVRLLIERCPRLTRLGKMTTWVGTDQVNSHNSFFAREEPSKFRALMEEVALNNLDITFDF